MMFSLRRGIGIDGVVYINKGMKSCFAMYDEGLLPLADEVEIIGVDDIEA